MAASRSARALRATSEAGRTTCPDFWSVGKLDNGEEPTGEGVVPGSHVPSLFLSNSIHLGRISIIFRAPSTCEGAVGIRTRPRTCAGEMFAGPCTFRGPKARVGSVVSLRIRTRGGGGLALRFLR